MARVPKNFKPDWTVFWTFVGTIFFLGMLAGVVVARLAFG